MKKMLGLLMALMVVSSATTFAADRHDFRGDSDQRQEYCCGGYYGDGGYCGGWRGRNGSNQ